LRKEVKMAGLITPEELRKTAEAKEMARAREAFEADKRRADESRQLQEVFMNRQIQADGRERLQKALLAAAERGADHIQDLHSQVNYAPTAVTR
jgi:hypothetical protein